MKQLLIIEPDLQTREVLRATFDGGYQLIFCTDEVQARPSLCGRADLLICGLADAGAFLAAHPVTIPVLVLSESPICLPGTEVLVKPFEVDAIRARVAALIPADPRDRPVSLEEAVSHFERGLIVRALQKCNGVQTHTAEMLGTTRRILRYKMDKLGIALSARKQT
jgi:hypothetical protein